MGVVDLHLPSGHLKPHSVLEAVPTSPLTEDLATVPGY